MSYFEPQSLVDNNILNTTNYSQFGAKDTLITKSHVQPIGRSLSGLRGTFFFLDNLILPCNILIKISTYH